MAFPAQHLHTTSVLGTFGDTTIAQIGDHNAGNVRQHTTSGTFFADSLRMAAWHPNLLSVFTRGIFRAHRPRGQTRKDGLMHGALLLGAIANNHFAGSEPSNALICN
jgi:hypothetical protein